VAESLAYHGVGPALAAILGCAARQVNARSDLCDRIWTGPLGCWVLGILEGCSFLDAPKPSPPELVRMKRGRRAYV